MICPITEIFVLKGLPLRFDCILEGLLWEGVILSVDCILNDVTL